MNIATRTALGTIKLVAGVCVGLIVSIPVTSVMLKVTDLLMNMELDHALKREMRKHPENFFPNNVNN